MIVLPALAGAQPPGAAPPAPVAVVEVVKRQLNLGQTFVGTVMPLRRSTIGSPVDGRVEQFLVNEGDRVTERQPLAQLRTRSLELERDAAQAELEFREHELEALEKSAPKEVDQAEARMQSAKALMEFNEKRLKRAQSLYTEYKEKIVSLDELEQQVSATEAARKAYDEMEAAWELATSGLWEAKIEQAKARVRFQQATIEKLTDDIDRHTIVAPFDGYVTREHTEVGQWVTRGGPVAEVIQIDYVDVEVPVLERYAPHLRVGSAAQVRIDALPAQTWEGQVSLIVPEADVRSRCFPVKVRLKNAPPADDPAEQAPLLKPGMFARVTLPVGRKGDVLMVPKDALVLGGAAPVVWVVRQQPDAPGQGTATPLPVELGVSYGSLIEVRGPIEPGQLVVVEGNERIQPGQPLALTKKPARERK